MGNDFRPRLMSGRYESVPAPLQHDAGQNPGGEGTRVDVDSVWQPFRLPHRRVAVDNDLAKIHPAAEKVIADPQQVCFVLLLQWNSRANSGVA